MTPCYLYRQIRTICSCSVGGLQGLWSQHAFLLCAHTILPVSRLRVVRRTFLQCDTTSFFSWQALQIIALNTISYTTARKCLAWLHQLFEVQALEVDLCICACCTSGRRPKSPPCNYCIPRRGAALGESRKLMLLMSAKCSPQEPFL